MEARIGPNRLETVGNYQGLSRNYQGVCFDSLAFCAIIPSWLKPRKTVRQVHTTIKKITQLSKSVGNYQGPPGNYGKLSETIREGHPGVGNYRGVTGDCRGVLKSTKNRRASSHNYQKQSHNYQNSRETISGRRETIANYRKLSERVTQGSETIRGLPETIRGS